MGNEPGTTEMSSLATLATEDVRRLDVDGKQNLVAKLLHDSECDGLLVLHPANFRWLTSGASPVGLYGRDETPALYFNNNQRWLLCSATDTQRFFAEELDGLGFQLKEWHWSTSREQMLADLTFGRKVAADQPFRGCKHAGLFFTSERRKLTLYEVERMLDLGKLVAHAVEATARNFFWGESEEEIAGQLAHRLVRHGAEPVALQVTGDGRGRAFRRRGYRPDPVKSWCVLQATARKFGLHATAARTVYHGPPGDSWRPEFEFVLRLRVVHLAASRPGELVSMSLDSGKSVLRPSPHEHEWRAASPVCLTGREPSEGIFLPTNQDRWVPGWVAVWQERIGATCAVDTYLLTEGGWKLATSPTEWPVRRAASNERVFELPDVLLRND
jgi:Xaa-Pro dipeptidase